MARRAKKKVKIQEGTWFGVPLEKGGWAVGLITRHLGGLIVMGHFFGPRRRTRPTRKSIDGLTREQAVWVGELSALGIKLGAWPILFVDPEFQRAQWPLVDVYLHDDSGRFEAPPPVDRQEELLRWLSLAGYGAAANRVEERLSSKAKRLRLPALETLPPEPPPKSKKKEKPPEEAVLISFKGSNIDWLDAFVDRLDKVLKPKVGEFDGHERGVGDGKLFFYGPSADVLWKSIEPVVRKEPALKGEKVTIRRGPPDHDSPERTIVLK